MGFSIAASHAKGKVSKDKIFAANDAAVKKAASIGKENVINATIGSIYDENEQIYCLPTVEKVYRGLPINEIIQYAGIAGLPEFIEDVVGEACGNSRPDAFIDVVATTGGTGALHHLVWNYSEQGDKIITSDWYWGAYASICQEALREITTYKMFDESGKYNVKGLEEKVRELAKTQKNVVVIINTPAHNPVGYTVSNAEWDEIIQKTQEVIKDTGKNIVLFVDLAYFDYAGEREEVRSFIKKFEKLPKEVLVILGYSMSKGFTLYGQRVGAMIGISSDKDVIQEFKDVNTFTSRATWSNINRAGMRILSNVCRDKEAFASVRKERQEIYKMLKARADIFTQEAQEVGLKMLPYIAGFFLSIESDDPDAICEKLKEDNIYAVPLAKGIRIAVCSVKQDKMKGLATKVKKAFDALEKGL